MYNEQLRAGSKLTFILTQVSPCLRFAYLVVLDGVSECGPSLAVNFSRLSLLDQDFSHKNARRKTTPDKALEATHQGLPTQKRNAALRSVLGI